jgi:hypothetical protein
MSNRTHRLEAEFNYDSFPFGAFAFARLDKRLKDEPLWRDAERASGRDPMGLTPKQPNIELFTTEVRRFLFLQ